MWQLEAETFFRKFQCSKTLCWLRTPSNEQMRPRIRISESNDGNYTHNSFGDANLDPEFPDFVKLRVLSHLCLRRMRRPHKFIFRATESRRLRRCKRNISSSSMASCRGRFPYAWTSRSRQSCSSFKSIYARLQFCCRLPATVWFYKRRFVLEAEELQALPE